VAAGEVKTTARSSLLSVSPARAGAGRQVTGAKRFSNASVVLFCSPISAARFNGMEKCSNEASKTYENFMKASHEPNPDRA
jgi:hypothetical protein